MLKPALLVSFVSTLLTVAACGDTGVAGRAADIDALSGDAAAGTALYETHCLACHGADARSGSAGEDLVDEVGEGGEFIEAILEGKDGGAMPAFAETLSDQDVADIVAYITGL